MAFYWWILIALAALILLVVVPMFAVTWKIARGVYEDKLVRTSPQKWARENSCPENPEHSRMYDMGMAWAAGHADRTADVTVTSEGLKLAGKYVDLGYRRCAIILPGRAESLNYSWFFAAPYERAHCNVLVVDTRAHGNSEGKYVGCGVRESRDLIEWIKKAQQLGNDEVVVHGICVGASSAVLAAVSPDCPGCLKKIVTEGLFTSFYRIFAQRTRNSGHPSFPIVFEIYLMCKKYAKADILRECASRYIGRLTTPVLMLHGLQDDAALPKYGQRLFDKCGSADKKQVWFERGAHSHLRINDVEKYDDTIVEFIES